MLKKTANSFKKSFDLTNTQYVEYSYNKKFSKQLLLILCGLMHNLQYINLQLENCNWHLDDYLKPAKFFGDQTLLRIQDIVKMTKNDVKFLELKIFISDEPNPSLICFSIYIILQKVFAQNVRFFLIVCFLLLF